MASNPSAPLCRIELHPFIDSWSGGPGRSFSVIRFGMWARLQTVTAEGGEPVLEPVVQAMLLPETPFSVLPHSLRETHAILCDQAVPENWLRQPLPVWRGIPCQVGTVVLRLRNTQAAPDPIEFRLLVLPPDRDPAGARPENLLIGSQFLTHYGFRVLFDYSALQYLTESGAGSPRIDSRATCGFLELG